MTTAAIDALPDSSVTPTQSSHTSVGSHPAAHPSRSPHAASLFAASLAPVEQAKLRRLARALLRESHVSLADEAGPVSDTSLTGAIVFVELDQARKSADIVRRTFNRIFRRDPGLDSALWLTVGIADALGAMLGRPVHVLVLAPAPPGAPANCSLRGSGPCPSLINHMPATEAVPALEQWPDEWFAGRLSHLRAAGQPVLVHAPAASTWIDLVFDETHCTGALLIVRSSQTRRAAIESLRLRLNQAAVSVLGAVLLDGKHAIPPSLYRLL